MIKTTPKMNETVKETLGMLEDNMSIYALQRIEELEAENKDLKTRIQVQKDYLKHL